MIFEVHIGSNRFFLQARFNNVSSQSFVALFFPKMKLLSEAIAFLKGRVGKDWVLVVFLSFNQQSCQVNILYQTLAKIFTYLEDLNE